MGAKLSRETNWDKLKTVLSQLADDEWRLVRPGDLFIGSPQHRATPACWLIYNSARCLMILVLAPVFKHPFQVAAFVDNKKAVYSVGINTSRPRSLIPAGENIHLTVNNWSKRTNVCLTRSHNGLVTVSVSWQRAWERKRDSCFLGNREIDSASV